MTRVPQSIDLSCSASTCTPHLVTVVSELRSWGKFRAEATDVANAVLDGVDCIMLGAETLRGKHPVATVETILHICKQAEKVFDHNYHFETLMRVSKPSMHSQCKHHSHAQFELQLPPMIGCCCLIHQ